MSSYKTVIIFWYFKFVPAIYHLYPYPTKQDRHNMFSSCCGEDSAIVITPDACLTSTLIVYKSIIHTIGSKISQILFLDAYE
jgi:hypothetical protein